MVRVKDRLKAERYQPQEDRWPLRGSTLLTVQPESSCNSKKLVEHVVGSNKEIVLFVRACARSGCQLEFDLKRGIGHFSFHVGLTQLSLLFHLAVWLFDFLET